MNRKPEMFISLALVFIYKEMLIKISINHLVQTAIYFGSIMEHKYWYTFDETLIKFSKELWDLLLCDLKLIPIS